MQDKLLTPNFYLKEFVSSLDVDIPNFALINLEKVANRLQVLRDFWGYPIIITSGYRTEAHNQEVGGAPRSFHLKGLAADFVVDGMGPQEVQEALDDVWSGGLGKASTYTHIDIRRNKARWSY